MTCLRSHSWAVGRQDLDAIYLLKSNASKTPEESPFIPPPTHPCLRPQLHGDTWQTQHAQPMQVEARAIKGVVGKWAIAAVGQGLSNFVPVIKMLIKVALRHPHLLTSWALTHIPQAAKAEKTGSHKAPMIKLPAQFPQNMQPGNQDQATLGLPVNRQHLKRGSGERQRKGSKREDCFPLAKRIPWIWLSSPGKIVSCSPSPSS